MFRVYTYMCTYRHFRSYIQICIHLHVLLFLLSEMGFPFMVMLRISF
jgi:hypothetical protein